MKLRKVELFSVLSLICVIQTFIFVIHFLRDLHKENFSQELTQRERQIFIFQVDTRTRNHSSEYWTISSAINRYYSSIHGYQYYYIISNTSCTKPGDQGKHDICVGPHGKDVHSPWMKVKATLWMLENRLMDGDVLFFFDSDAMIAIKDHKIATGPGAINLTIPFSFPNIWSSFINGTRSAALIYSTKTYWKALANEWNYTRPINAGGFMFIKNDFTMGFVKRWWNSLKETTTGDIVKNWDFGTHWPWEQERLSYLAGLPENEPSICFFDDILGWSTSAMPLMIHYCARDNLRNKKNMVTDALDFFSNHFSCEKAGLAQELCRLNRTDTLIDHFISDEDVIIL